MTTYHNQKIITINRAEKYSEKYLSIADSEWLEAANNLTYATFKLYLYLASNTNGFKLALSKVAVKNKINMSEKTYSNSVKELTEKGYLVETERDEHNSYYTFSLTPQTVEFSTTLGNSDGVQYSTTTGYGSTVPEGMVVDYHRVQYSTTPQISNISKINNLSKNADAQDADAKKERELEELTDEELKSIISDYKAKTKYMVTKERLNLRVQVTQETHKEAESILAQREQENKKDTLAQMGISLDRAVTLDEAYLFATDVLRFSVTKEEMQEDMNVHAKYGQLYTWNDFVSPPKQLNRNTFFDYTAGLCSMLAN